MLNFNHLYYFHIVATLGSIKAAADKLGVTQPTVSEQLRMLEKTLGVELFDRTPTGLRPTHSGRQAYEHTSAMFLAGERLVRSLGKETARPSMSLRVGMSANMARTTAADFLMPVLSVQECRPYVRTGDFQELMQGVRSQDLDLIIGETEPAEVARVGLAVELIYRPRLVAVVVPELDPKPDWKNLSILMYRSASVYHWEVETFLQTHGLEPKVMGELDDAFLMIEAAQRGGFVAFVPKSVARDALRSQRVKALLTLSTRSAGIYAVYPDGEASQLARSVVKRLIASAGHELEE